MQFFKQKPNTFDYTLERVCKNCRHGFNGKYCNLCGEKVLEPGEKSIREFLWSILNAFTFLENKFWRTLWYVISRPGFISKNFSEGIRQPYMKPVALFFVSNFIFFILPLDTANTLNLPFQYQQLTPYYTWVEGIVLEHIKESGLNPEQFALLYNAHSLNLSKMLIVLLVILTAVPLALLNHSRSWYFADHLYVSFEFNSFFIFINLIALPLFIRFFDLLLQFFSAGLMRYLNDTLWTILFIISSAYFYIKVFVEFYHNSWWTASLKTIVLLACSLGISVIYRAALFFVSLWSM